jgi:hypothetical protein
MIIQDQDKQYDLQWNSRITNDIRNPQANATVERIHQVFGNIVQTFELEGNYLGEDDPWKGILSATVFAVQQIFRTSVQSTQGQLVFGRHMIFIIQHINNWEYMKQRKQHVYCVGGKVQLNRVTEIRYESLFLEIHLFVIVILPCFMSSLLINFPTCIAVYVIELLLDSCNSLGSLIIWTITATSLNEDSELNLNIPSPLYGLMMIIMRMMTMMMVLMRILMLMMKEQS